MERACTYAMGDVHSEVSLLRRLIIFVALEISIWIVYHEERYRLFRIDERFAL
jgi:hypothetical protein